MNSYPKHVWSPAGGWYSQPANWKANTAVMGGVVAGIVALAWGYSAEHEFRNEMPRVRLSTEREQRESMGGSTETRLRKAYGTLSVTTANSTRSPIDSSHRDTGAGRSSSTSEHRKLRRASHEEGARSGVYYGFVRQGHCIYHQAALQPVNGDIHDHMREC